MFSHSQGFDALYWMISTKSKGDQILAEALVGEVPGNAIRAIQTHIQIGLESELATL